MNEHMTLDDPAVTRALFHPRQEDYGYVPQGMPTETGCRGATVCGYLHVCSSSDTLLLFFHGNGEVAADYDPLASLYTGNGVSLWVVDYRGYGRSTGTPSFSHMLADAEALLDDVPRLERNLGRAFKRIMVKGRSLGSAPAIHLASQHSNALAGLILDSAYADGWALVQRLGGPKIAREEMPAFQDNIDKIRHCRLPTLLIHGTADRIIPLADAQALLRASGSERKRLAAIEGAGHNNLLWVGFEAYDEALRQFLTGRMKNEE